MKSERTETIICGGALAIGALLGGAVVVVIALSAFVVMPLHLPTILAVGSFVLLLVGSDYVDRHQHQRISDRNSSGSTDVAYSAQPSAHALPPSVLYEDLTITE